MLLGWLVHKAFLRKNNKIGKRYKLMLHANNRSSKAPYRYTLSHYSLRKLYLVYSLYIYMVYYSHVYRTV